MANGVGLIVWMVSPYTGWNLGQGGQLMWSDATSQQVWPVVTAATRVGQFMTSIDSGGCQDETPSPLSLYWSANSEIQLLRQRRALDVQNGKVEKCDDE